MITAEDNSCTTNKVVKVNYYELPKVEISDPGIVCENSKKELIAEVTGGSTSYIYEWSGLIASSEENKAVTNLLTPADNNEKFKVSVTDKNGCIGTDSTQVEVAENPTITIAVEKSEICEGDIAKLTASGAGNDGTYLWNTNETGAIITPTILGEISFNVTGTDHNNCVGTSEYVTIKKKDLPQLEVSGEKEICVGESTTITLSAIGSNSAKFYWIEDSEIGQYAKAIEGATRELSPTELTSYKVRIEDKDLWVGTAHLDHVANDANRIYQAKAIKPILESLDAPFVFGGDFNDEPGSKTIEIMSQYTTFAYRSATQYTFPSNMFPHYDKQLLDYVTYYPRGSFIERGYNVLHTVKASDHMPVVAVLNMDY